ncbi:MAG: hypothetical protein JSS98_00470 [Bacteroidetes bacterium]|nr:hypothetical protein [Bacteroidota bacterium]
MKIVGGILIVIGIAMIVFQGFSVPVEKNIIDAGPIQVNKTENKWIGWPSYTGAILAVAGVVMVIVGGKQKS